MRVGEETIADLKAMGASSSSIAELKTEMEDDEGILIEVEPENAVAVRLFLRLQTQWRRTVLSNGKRTAILKTGLDYAALPPIASAMGIALDEFLLDSLRLLESKTVEIHTRRQMAVLDAR